MTTVEKYGKASGIEHVLLRPGMYIGGVSQETSEQYVFNAEKGIIERKSIKYSPGLYKILDEILVNAMDHAVRTKGTDCPVTEIIVNLDNDSLSVQNNGLPIEVIRSEKHGVYYPELVFGHLRSSENFDDTKIRMVGGMNGMGSKATNIFSKRFIVEVGDATNELKFCQEYSDNMSKRTTPKITKCKKNYTKITTFPDFPKFECTNFSYDFIALISRRVYDIAGCIGWVKIKFNGELIKINKFQDYAKLYGVSTFGGTSTDGYWEVAVGLADTFTAVSFVNGIYTKDGGKHVDYITKQFVDNVHKSLCKKNKGVTIKKNVIKNNLFLFIRCNINCPGFNSQTKDYMNTPVEKFGSKFEVPAKLIDSLGKLGLYELVMLQNNQKVASDLKKTDGKKKNTVRVEKYISAEYSGTSKSKDCTLLLTEGDSAATLMLAGLSQEQRKYFGVMPLKGKGLNICNATAKQLQENTELINIKKIMGLESGKKYTDVSELRYGRIMIATDADHDGLHIKALLFNMIKNLWPSLFEMPNFLCSFKTPIVKATKGNKVLSFFTEADYMTFKNKNESGWKIKYYKGLGTSSKQEAVEYFKNLASNSDEYQHSDITNEAFDKVFNKTRADDRKQWLSKYDRNSQSAGSKIRLDSFINNDFIHFSNDDLSRSIPNVLDGLKVSQRKILFSAFKRGLTSEIKVAQLAGYVSEHSGYHHGEKSLEDAIVGLAQNFTGSNNINLLEPIGQFGSRLNNGKDAASARYIFTHLSKITKLIFDQRDFGIIDYKNDDGTSVEPWWYLPIIPMILVNGAVGIGTGFSTKMPCFNPKDIIQVLLSKLKGETGKELIPWYRNFAGTVLKVSDGTYMTYGVFTETKKEIVITELPISTSVNDYLEYLNIKHSDNFKQVINLSTDTEICIKLTKRNEIKDIVNTLKLVSKVSYSNMNAFDIDSRIMNFSSPETIIEYFFDVRLAYYSKRKRVLLAELDEIIKDLSNRIRFIDEITNKKIKMSDISVAELTEYLQSKKFDKRDNTYEYLYKMNMISLTKEHQTKLKNKLVDTQSERNKLFAKSPSELYQTDLMNLLTYV